MGCLFATPGSVVTPYDGYPADYRQYNEGYAGFDGGGGDSRGRDRNSRLEPPDPDPTRNGEAFFNEISIPVPQNRNLGRKRALTPLTEETESNFDFAAPSSTVIDRQPTAISFAVEEESLPPAAKDTFSPPRDTFSPPEDTFNPLRDTFSPPRDTFSPPRDTFSPPRDTFSPPRDTFSPPRDTFTAKTRDTFSPPRDTFTAKTQDTFNPPRDTFTAKTRDTFSPKTRATFSAATTFYPRDIDDDDDDSNSESGDNVFESTVSMDPYSRSPSRSPRRALPYNNDFDGGFGIALPSSYGGGGMGMSRLHNQEDIAEMSKCMGIVGRDMDRNGLHFMK